MFTNWVCPPVGVSTFALSMEPNGGTSRSVRSMCQKKVARFVAAPIGLSFLSKVTL